MNEYPSTRLIDVKISLLTLEALISEVEQHIAKYHRLLIGYVNIHAMNLAFDRPEFKKALDRFDILFCDGIGVKVGAGILGKKIPERYTPPDFIDEIMRILREVDSGVFLLGAKPGIAEKAAEVLKHRNPGLRIAGISHGYFDKTPDCDETNDVVKAINEAAPTMLLVGFGMPLQEEWVVNNWDKLNVTVVLMVGALFDTLSGETARGPKFLTDHGFEWLGRLIIEPRRLWKRYIIGNPLFFWRIVKKRFGS